MSAIALRPDTTPARRSDRPSLAREALAEDTEQRSILGQFVNHNMRDGTDYGVIPGTDKRVLLKPGAEKLVGLFRCSAEYVIEKEVEQFGDTTTAPLFYYRFRVNLISQDTGNVVAVGYGSGSTHESKYRYRSGDRVCPECGKPAIMKSKFPPRSDPQSPPGFYCYAKKGGCGIEFRHDDDRITGQTTGRVENPDAADFANTVLKMSKKRALVDAAVSLTRSSDLFTQDMDDDAPPRESHQTARPAPIEPDPENSALFTKQALEAIVNAKDMKRRDEIVKKLVEDNKAKLFTESDWATIKQAAIEKKAELEKAAPAQQPAEPAKNDPQAAIRRKFADQLTAAGERLQKEFGINLDDWLGERIEMNLTAETLIGRMVTDKNGTGNLALVLGQLNTWMDDNIPD